MVASEMKPGDIIYLVIHTDYDDYEILGAFTTLADAKEFESALERRGVASGRYSSLQYATDIITLRAETSEQAQGRIRPSDRGRPYLAPPPEGEA